MAETEDDEDNKMAASSSNNEEDLVVATATTTADESTMSESGDQDETTAAATTTQNGHAEKQPKMEVDDEATASEDEGDASSSTPPPPPKSNDISITITKKKPTTANKPLPTLKLTLNASKQKKTPPKSMRIKLKLPTQANSSTASAASPAKQSGPSSTKSTVLSKQATGMGSRRRPVVPSKHVRLPPIASPGLVQRHKPTPAQVFDTTMAHAGYTLEQRTHRGSSVRRTVDDLFDTDTRLALHKLELVPSELMTETYRASANGTEVKGDDEAKEATENKKRLTDVLLERLAGRKRPRVTRLRDMVPVSLTLPYPESYRQAYLQYLRKVDEREQTIVEWQEAAEMIEELDSDDTNPVVVPPIPSPPEPPKLSELQGYKCPHVRSEDRHPLYLPTLPDSTVAPRVAHLDPDCFHITNGRYFGLATNNINDPQVCGPNAPGCSGSGGLATATTSTTTSTSGLSGGGMTLILSAGFHCAAAVPAKDGPPTTTTTAATKPASSSSAASKLAPVLHPGADMASTRPTPTTTATENANALRLVMMDPEWADRFRVAIWKAAVYACRTQTYDANLCGPNGHVYPDLGRAFSSYGLVKPCLRCKNNKQGVYHCRVRRKHQEADFDGGNSVASLTQYQDTPLELLLEQPSASATTEAATKAS